MELIDSPRCQRSKMLKAYHHLTRDHRCQIYALKKRGLRQSEIAVDIGVKPSILAKWLIYR
jgi:IS30 family transposase